MAPRIFREQHCYTASYTVTTRTTWPDKVAASFSPPPPSALEIHDSQVAEKWRKFKLTWVNYSLAGLNKKVEAVQVATLLTVIGEEAHKVFSTFQWDMANDDAKIKPVLDKFATYCQPAFERYRFNRHMQEAGESYMINIAQH